MLNIIYILIMRYTSISKQATCKVCGLTSRTKGWQIIFVMHIKVLIQKVDPFH